MISESDSEKRLVALSAEDVRFIGSGVLKKRWDDSPADPVDVLSRALVPHDTTDRSAIDANARALLRSLGLDVSGRRAAENTNTTPNDARLVPMDSADIDAIRFARILLVHRERTVEEEAHLTRLYDLQHRYEAAPADPIATANQAVPWECHHAEAVLLALGYPDGLRRQDNPTP